MRSIVSLQRFLFRVIILGHSCNSTCIMARVFNWNLGVFAGTRIGEVCIRVAYCVVVLVKRLVQILVHQSWSLNDSLINICALIIRSDDVELVLVEFLVWHSQLVSWNSLIVIVQARNPICNIDIRECVRAIIYNAHACWDKFTTTIVLVPLRWFLLTILQSTDNCLVVARLLKRWWLRLSTCLDLRSSVDSF